MNRSSVTVGLAAAALVAVLGGCTTGTPLMASTNPGKTAGPDQPAFSQFSDIPVPAGAKMDLEHSLLLGDADAWIGRLAMTTADSASTMYNFYFREMPRFRWSPVTSVRSETSVLTYTRSDRVATIQIRGRTMGGAAVSVTVSPRGKPLRATPPEPNAGVGGPVQMSPLR